VAVARVDLPDPDNPVNQMVAPFIPSASQRSSRPSDPGDHTTSGCLSTRQSPPRIIPAPTVTLVSSLARMKEPVVRLRR
jgi:hypothetical protein